MQVSSRWRVLGTYDGDIVKVNIEIGSTLSETVLDHAAHQFSLCDELCCIESSLNRRKLRIGVEPTQDCQKKKEDKYHNAFQHLIDDRRQHSLIVVVSQLLVNLGKLFPFRLGQHSQRYVHHLQICDFAHK